MHVNDLYQNKLTNKQNKAKTKKYIDAENIGNNLEY